jgi:hypothetical protein
MKTRIRYKKMLADMLVSKGNFLLPTGELIYIELDTSSNTYKFVSTVDQNVVSEGTTKNFLTLKKLVRSTLIELGVPLEVEKKTWTKKQTEVAA